MYVVGVRDGVAGVVLGGLLVGIAHEDVLMEFLHGPAILGKVPREIIQQGGVGGIGGAQSEFVDGRDDTLAKVMQPNAVNHHARSERVVLGSNSLSKFQPTRAILEWLAVFTGKNLEELPGHHLATLVAVALYHDGFVAWVALVKHHHRSRRRALMIYL